MCLKPFNQVYHFAGLLAGWGWLRKFAIDVGGAYTDVNQRCQIGTIKPTQSIVQLAD